MWGIKGWFSFVLLGGKGGVWCLNRPLRERFARYYIVFGAENSGLSLDNGFLWDDL
ncbi:MAG: hypothetical protein GY820_12505 [Gammaproteobacteria bacterium]|nr:hypothetical protein [Gammaproteobacteria bacterium]